MSHEDKAREIVGRYGPLRWALVRPNDDSNHAIKTFAQSVGIEDKRAVAAITTALREAADTWYRIDDPEHPAPKDGTWIMLGYFLEAGGGGMPSTAWWHDTRKLWCGHEGFLNAEGYFSPTHWRPLPPPPSDKGNSP